MEEREHFSCLIGDLAPCKQNGKDKREAFSMILSFKSECTLQVANMLRGKTSIEIYNMRSNMKI